MTSGEFDDLEEVFTAAATQLGPPGAAGGPFIQRVLQPFAQARAAWAPSRALPAAALRSVRPVNRAPPSLLSPPPPPALPAAQAFRELRSGRVQCTGGEWTQRASYQLRSLARFLEAGRAYTAELQPVALLLLVLHGEKR